MTSEDRSLASVKKAPSATQSAKGKKRWNNVPKKERSRAMTRVAHQRWEGVTQTEEQLREYFENSDLDAILATYSVMRKHYEAAGRIIDKRVQAAQQERCSNCGTEFTRDKLWYHKEAVKDPLTQVITNIFSCSQACMIALKGKQPSQRRFS